MPYIPEDKRKIYEDLINDLSNAIVDNTLYDQHLGHLNYIFTMLINEYHKKIKLNKNVSYRDINSYIGVLECCKLELYRKVAASYENEKEEENGKVYDIG